NAAMQPGRRPATRLVAMLPAAARAGASIAAQRPAAPSVFQVVLTARVATTTGVSAWTTSDDTLVQNTVLGVFGEGRLYPKNRCPGRRLAQAARGRTRRAPVGTRW